MGSGDDVTRGTNRDLALAESALCRIREEVEKLDYGDVGFFKERVNKMIDYYFLVKTKV